MNSTPSKFMITFRWELIHFLDGIFKKGFSDEKIRSYYLHASAWPDHCISRSFHRQYLLSTPAYLYIVVDCKTTMEVIVSVDGSVHINLDVAKSAKNGSFLALLSLPNRWRLLIGCVFGLVSTVRFSLWDMTTTTRCKNADTVGFVQKKWQN